MIVIRAYLIIGTMLIPGYSYANIHDKEQSLLPAVISGKEDIMKEAKFLDRFEHMDLRQIPAVIELEKEENIYLSGLVDSAIEVVSSKKDLSEEDYVFGKGQFFFPKDPKKVARLSIYYGAENFRLRSITAGFRRLNPEGPWCGVTVSVRPRNFPTGVYSVNLAPSLLSSLRLEHSHNEKRPNQPVKDVNIFRYGFSRNGANMNLIFESKSDVSPLNEEPPKIFHNLIIERISEDCLKSAK